jgi:hypothetical protein
LQLQQYVLSRRSSKHKATSTSADANAKSNYVPGAKRAGQVNQLKQNKGLVQRQVKDQLALQEASTSSHHRQTILQAKAALYEKLR